MSERNDEPQGEQSIHLEWCVEMASWDALPDGEREELVAIAMRCGAAWLTERRFAFRSRKDATACLEEVRAAGYAGRSVLIAS